MKYFVLSAIICLNFFKTNAQTHFEIHSIRLPNDVAYYDNQYSSLYIADGKLYLMSESRLEDHAEAFLTSVNLKDLDKAIIDSSYQSVFTKIPIMGLDIIRDKIKQQNESYEGLEAAVVKNNSVYLSIETATPSNDCYLVKGNLNAGKIIIDTSKLLRLSKPKDVQGQHIYNAGFESLEMLDDNLCAVFEYNYFPENNYALIIDTSLNENKTKQIPISKWPFRITDITRGNDKKTLFGINFFFNGDGKDAVYRVPESDAAYKLTTENGKDFRSYARLIKINFDGNRLSCETYLPLPAAYQAFNWEGLSEYKNGFFIINDKYTPKRPYYTAFSYLEIK